MSDAKCSQCGLELAIDGGQLCSKCEMSLGDTVLIEQEPTSLNGVDDLITATDVKAGEIFGNYELIEEVSRGGMGVVYKAKHTQLNRVAALKMILSGRFSSEADLQRFYLEAEAAATLEHPGIVPFYEIGKVDGQAFFAMKFVEGGSLAARMSEIRQQPEAGVAMLNKVAEAVHYAHQRGILHRDLKPANILIDEEGQPLLIDLGLAKKTRGKSDLTDTGAVMGTPSYMPPEQASGKGAVTTAADVYSLGAILYELLTGRPPHQGESGMDTVVMVLHEAPLSPRQINVRADLNLALICMKCLERDPNDRYESALALSNDLECWLEGRAISVRPPTLIAKIGQWARDNHRLVYLMFAIMAGMLLTIPFLMQFLTDQRYTLVYVQYPHLERPWLLSMERLPEWTDDLAVLILAGLGSSTGFLTAFFARPQSVWRALGVGCLTAVLLYTTFLIFLGWMPLMLTSNSSWRVRRMAAVIWPTEAEIDAQERLRLANNIFPGLTQIPENERADAVVALLEGTQLSEALVTLMLMTAVVAVVSIPLILGTALGWTMLVRKDSILLAFFRYQIVWWMVPVILLFLANALVPAPFLGPRTERYGRLVSVATACLAVFPCYLAFRRRPASQ